MLSLMIAAQIATATPTTTEQSAQVETEQAGKIVFYRQSSIMGMGIACPIRYEGREIVELGRGKFAEWPVQPGRYVVTNKTSSAEVTVAAGETRYVRCSIKPGFMTGRADLQIVDRASFAEHQADYERKDVAFTPDVQKP